MTHKWNIEVEKEISIELTCNPDSDVRGPANEYKLKFEFDVDEEQKRDLIEKGVANVKSEVEFKALNDWKEIRGLTEGDGEVEMVISAKGDLSRMVVRLYGGDEWDRTSKFYCKELNLTDRWGNDSEKAEWTSGETLKVLIVSMTSLNSKTLMDNGSIGENFEVSTNCRLIELGKLQTTCGLKVTTANSLRN